jgi:succinate dehydrogenase iron-sulfur subunit
MTQSAATTGSKVAIRIRRQDGPGKPPRWEEFSVPRRANLNVATCLEFIAARPVQMDGKATTPPAWEADCRQEVCGACAMLINGRARPACSAMVEQLVEADSPITLEPLSKFPVVRDLMVDRRRLMEGLERVRAFVPIDGSYDLGPAPAVSPATQSRRYPLSRCIGCACCLEACPEFTEKNKFVGAAVISQARLFNEHPIGAELKADRLDGLMEEGGVQDCAKSGNCVEACPRDIPLLESIAVVSRQTTVHAVRKFFGG